MGVPPDWEGQEDGPQGPPRVQAPSQGLAERGRGQPWRPHREQLRLRGGVPAQGGRAAQGEEGGAAQGEEGGAAQGAERAGQCQGAQEAEGGKGAQGQGAAQGPGAQGAQGGARGQGAAQGQGATQGQGAQEGEECQGQGEEGPTNKLSISSILKNNNQPMNNQ